MKKKSMALVIIIIISLLFVNLIFAQEIERLTFTDMRSDGTIIGTVTVNAIFITWTQQRFFIENGMQVTRESVYLVDLDDWSPWEIVDRRPSYALTLMQIYNMGQSQYNRAPRGATRIHTQGVQAVRIMVIPEGRSSPLWWTEDGMSYNILYEVWAILP